MNMSNIGDVLSQHRQNRQMTQEEFASRIGVSSQAVSKWERGQSMPDISLLADICRILDIDSNTLLGISERNRIIEGGNETVQREIKQNMCAEPLKIEIGAALIPVFAEGLKTNLINQKRKSLVAQTGILVPIIRIVDVIELDEMEYRISSYNETLHLGKVSEIKVDTYSEVIGVLFDQCVKYYSYILNKQMVKTLIDNVKEKHPGVADDLIPEQISYLAVQKVLASIVSKTGNIHNMIKIIEIMEEEMICNENSDIDIITEKIIRQGIHK